MGKTQLIQYIMYPNLGYYGFVAWETRFLYLFNDSKNLYDPNTTTIGLFDPQDQLEAAQN